MATRVLKFPLAIGRNLVQLPGVATGRPSVGMQNGTTTLWVPVRDAGRLSSTAKEFVVVLTGEEFDSTSWEYLGHCINESGTFVTHVYGRGR